MPDKELVYTNVPHMKSLVFAPLKTAECVSDIHCASRAKTWGEFKASMPSEELERLIEIRHSEEEEEAKELPADDDKFDPSGWLPGWEEGDYPEWLQTRQDEWLPRSVLDNFAEYDTSVLNGGFGQSIQASKWMSSTHFAAAVSLSLVEMI